MTKMLKCASVMLSVGLLIIGHAARAEQTITANSCQAQLDAVANEWNAVGLPALPAGPIRAIQAKAGVIKLANGYATSAANFQYMAIQFQKASDACHAGDAGTALETVALVRDRLNSMAR